MATLTELIFSAKLKRKVKAGEIVKMKADRIMSHDTTTPLAIQAMRKITKKVFNPEKIVVVLDHIYPPSTIDAANLQGFIRGFVKEQKIKHFYREGVCHQIMVEKGLVKPGEVIIGGDSHTCTYGALSAFATGMGSTDIGVAYATGVTWFRIPQSLLFVLKGKLKKGVFAKDIILYIISKVGADGANYKTCEFVGPGASSLSIEGRLTITNMVIEMGGKAGLFRHDEKLKNYLEKLGIKKYPTFKPKDGYEQEMEIDLSKIPPQVALSPRVDNGVNIKKVQGIKIDEVFIGTCTNGRVSDLKIAAKILRNRKVNQETRLIIIPASLAIYKEAQKKGYLDIFHQAGAVIGNPGCGPCIGRHQGTLGDGERALTTMNRNFVGRMGSAKAKIYLASPATAAATAIYGQITDPRKLI